MVILKCNVFAENLKDFCIALNFQFNKNFTYTEIYIWWSCPLFIIFDYLID